jgi:hypothetical protein
VGDEDQGAAQAASQAAEQVEHPRGEGGVERRDGLVAEQQPGRFDHRAGDGDALALAAREDVRAQPGHLLGQADKAQRLGDARLAVGRGEVAHPLADQLGNAQPGGERGARVLEDHLRRCAVAEPHPSPGGLEQPRHDPQQGALAAAALADHRHRLTRSDGQRQAAQGVEAGTAGPAQHAAARGAEGDHHVVDGHPAGARCDRGQHGATAEPHRRGEDGRLQAGALAGVPRRGQRRRLAPRAVVAGDRAARLEGAPGARCARVGRLAAERGQLHAAEAAQRQPRGEQRRGVGMLGSGGQGGGGAGLHESPGVEHADAIGDGGGHAQVVGDEEHAAAGLVAQRAQQAEDLRLHGDVERGGGLVGDHQPGTAGQRDGDHHPLPQPAGQLVRILGQPSLGIGDAHRTEQAQRLLG